MNFFSFFWNKKNITHYSFHKNNELYDEKTQELRGTVNNMCVGTIIDSYKIAINKEIIKY